MFVAAVLLAMAPAADQSLDPILARISEEAEVFAQKAPRAIGQERMVHRGRLAAPRFRPRPGVPKPEIPATGYHRTELTSEYGFGFLRDAPDSMRELRQVVTVNGKQVRDPKKARLTLAMGIRSEDDRLSRQMLQDLEAYGLIGAVTDFGQILLLFRRQRLADYAFSIKQPIADLGGEPVTVVAWRQRKTAPGANVHHDKQVDRVPMRGEIWVRQRDHLPLRVTMSIVVNEDAGRARHDSTVNYSPSEAHGIVLPVSFLYSKRSDVNKFLLVENRAEYSGFKLFTAETEIKFQ